MSEQSKTVFISYRRSPSKYLSLLLFRELTARGYDVFRDVERIGAGDFEKVILSQIAARAHFVVLLTHGTLERCIEAGDWLRREIEEAIQLQRNIIPVLVDGFRFEDGEEHLTGLLQNLKKYNGLNLYSEYFDAGLEKLCDKYLVIPDYGKIKPTPAEIENSVKEILEETQGEPTPTQDEITAERLFVEALKFQKAEDFSKAIELYTQAIELNPTYTKAYYNRGLAYYKKGDLEEAIQDYTKTLELDSKYSKPYVNRGVALSRQGKHEEAIIDYETAIHLQQDYSVAYLNRGNSFLALNKHQLAIEDYRKFVGLTKDKPSEQRERIQYLISHLENYGETRPLDKLVNILPGELEDTSTQLFVAVSDDMMGEVCSARGFLDTVRSE